MKSSNLDNTGNLMYQLKLSFLGVAILLFFIQSCTNTHNTSRNTYYLDPVGALHSGTGKSPDDPALQLPAEAYGKPGTTILYKRGIKVRGGIEVFPGTPKAPVIVGSYGEGALPVFIKSVSLDNEKKWENEGGNIWRYTQKLDTVCANIIYNDDEYCGAIRWNKESLKEQGDWYMIDSIGGDVRYEEYLNVFSTDNPAKIYDGIEYVPVGNFHSFSSNDSCIVIQDIHMRNAGTHGVWFNGAKSITLRRCDISYIGGAVFPAHMQDNTRVRYGNAVEIWEAGNNILVEHNRIYENYDAGFVAQGSAHDGSIDSVVVRNNIFWNNGFDNFDNSWGRAITRVYFENNTCIDAGDGWAFETEGRPRLSEFLPDSIGWHVFLDSFALDRSHIWIRNNIFYNATQNKLLKVNAFPKGGWPHVHLDYNCYFQKDPNDPIVQIVDDIYGKETFGKYQEITGKDHHSIIADPLFIDLEKRDYRLKAGSPCIGAAEPGSANIHIGACLPAE